jgi:hypothetical protein
VKPSAPDVRLSAEQFQAMLDAVAKTGGGGVAGMDADALAAAFHKQTHPDNPRGPQISYLNPKGERDNPRPTFVARAVHQNGVPLYAESLMPEEIEAINALPSGNWQIPKADGSAMLFDVTRTMDNNGDVERLSITYPIKGDDRHNHRPFLTYLLDALRQAGKAEDATRIEALSAALNELRLTLFGKKR